MSSARDTGPTFRALLIGIDVYLPNRLSNDATYVSLRCCVSDVERIDKILSARITMPYKSTKLLAPNIGRGAPGGDRKTWPTYSNMKAALDELLASTQPGDHVYIHYSGHGGRVPTMFTHLKPGGVDETLVPMDIGDGSTPYLRDLEIAHYLDALTTKNQATVTVVLDSCHSGDATRGNDFAPRCATGARKGADPTLDTTERPTGGVAPDDALSASWNRLEATGRALRGAAATTWLPEAKDYVLLAACRDVETAIELQRGDEAGGVLTTAFIKALTEAGDDQTWKTLYERVLAHVHSRYPSQTPQLLGQGARQILGSKLRPVVSTVTVKDVDVARRRVKLGAGRVTGTPTGAKFGIYPLGTTDFTQVDRRVGVATIEKMMAVESWASLEEGAAIEAVKLGAPAVLEDVGSIALRRAVNLFHRDDLAPGIDQDRALGAVGAEIKTRGRGFLELATGEAPYYQVALDKDRHYEIWDGSGKPPTWGRWRSTHRTAPRSWSLDLSIFSGIRPSWRLPPLSRGSRTGSASSSSPRRRRGRWASQLWAGP
ncbi:caspase family protein [Sorangium atrum]|uniref:Caspase family protein n=1 Tax=Sorangium atrum TaxID=2995308 RepID=A0ABT5C039_9BACT|nr:caspase family protein [Sorangium aterium]MDC0679323.1 caspase family protein [Sorangium aterium]